MRFFVGILALVVVSMSCNTADQSNRSDDVEQLDSSTTNSSTDSVEIIDRTTENSEVTSATDKWQIDDYVNLLMDSYIQLSTEPATTNDWFFDTLDIKGGFASTRGAVEGWQEFALWRMSDGNDLVIAMLVGCGPACDYTYQFYVGKGRNIKAYSETQLVPLTEIEEHKKGIIPKIIEAYPVDYPEDDQLVYNLPQKGTGMRVDVVVGADEIRVPILFLKWDGNSFSIHEKYTAINVVNG